MYKCSICGKELQQCGVHHLTHAAGGFVPWNKDGRECRAETLLKMSVSQKERFKRMPTPNKGIKHSANTRLKISLALRGRPHIWTETARQKQSKNRKGVARPLHVQHILRENLRKIRANPALLERRAMKSLQTRMQRPTRLEKLFLALCRKHNLPYRYVGNGEIWIARANPDFINVNGKKQVVEILGRYWHTEQETQARIAHYKQYGFDCIPIWEEELEDEELILCKLRSKV